jgi:hypothetical protein
MMHKYDYGRKKGNAAAVGWTVFIVIVLIVMAAAWLLLGADWSWW